MTTTTTIKQLFATALALALIALLAAPAIAASFTIELDERIIRGQEGERHHLGGGAVPVDIVGLVCSVTASGNNNGSVHPGNNVEASSGDSTVTLVDVERVPNATTTAVGELTMGESVVATLILGPDGVYSAGLILTFECREATTTTTTTISTTSTTTTTTPPTTTTEPPPTTTTTAPPTTTTTTPPPSTTTPTTSPPTTPPTTPPSTLPRTGASGEMAGVGLVALLLGAGLIGMTRGKVK